MRVSHSLALAEKYFLPRDWSSEHQGGRATPTTLTLLPIRASVTLSRQETFFGVIARRPDPVKRRRSLLINTRGEFHETVMNRFNAVIHCTMHDTSHAVRTGFKENVKPRTQFLDATSRLFMSREVRRGVIKGKRCRSTQFVDSPSRLSRRQDSAYPSPVLRAPRARPLLTPTSLSIWTLVVPAQWESSQRRPSPTVSPPPVVTPTISSLSKRLPGITSNSLNSVVPAKARQWPCTAEIVATPPRHHSSQPQPRFSLKTAAKTDSSPWTSVSIMSCNVLDRRQA
jgi:hypothetical protein